MDRIEYFAEISIRRALAFATLAIMTTMVGMVYDPATALKTGAVLTGIVAATLAWKAHRAPTSPYRRTEVWMLLDRRHDLPEDRAQQVIGGVLSRIYWRYAEFAGYVAALLWGTGLAYALLK
ncbi:hypothetical protein [Arenibaculum sp.]|jgi:hypothetical protein|uniref:hypothetical protein n=1 Tax=Arenibaculum sp. TaxID=2865862 RepID=UPI002E132D72|nr:hypothetical protein [Arenibaculum sp.]